jgi:hypothetical protein
MSAATEQYTVAKKRNDMPQKLDVEVIRLARIVAAYRGESPVEYLSARMLPIIQADLDYYAKGVGKAPPLPPPTEATKEDEGDEPDDEPPAKPRKR